MHVYIYYNIYYPYSLIITIIKYIKTEFQLILLSLLLLLLFNLELLLIPSNSLYTTYCIHRNHN